VQIPYLGIGSLRQRGQAFVDLDIDPADEVVDAVMGRRRNLPA
jgi:hypothetical protein